MNAVSSFILVFSRVILVYSIFMLPYQLYLLDIRTNIFPSLDLVIIFLLSIKYSKISYIKLFLLGIFLDYLNGFESCIYPIILISSECVLRYFRSNNNLNYVSKLTLFVYYMGFVTFIKYVMLSLIVPNNIYFPSVLMQYLTTILFYPLIYVPLAKLLKLAK